MADTTAVVSATPPETKLYSVQRKKVLERYEKTNRPYQAYTRPYKSTGQIQFDVVDLNSVGGNVVMGHAVARKGQIIQWFQYGVGETIPFGPPGFTKVASEADTNVSKGRQTNGVESFVIESMSSSFKDVRVRYVGTTGVPIPGGATVAFTDPATIAAYAGLGIIIDPGSLMSPPQVNSPFNLELPMGEACKPSIAIEFEWDRSRIIKIGTLDEIPEGGAKSFLKASGNPDTSDRYRCPEGYIWERQGLPDSEFIVRGTLADDIVMPFNTIGLGGAAAPTNAGGSNLVTNFFVDIVLRLHGLAVSYPSRN